uniref:Putative secreted protein n=1 Tax=Anopheles darlingi TaxID=43151 RepID=A0A2M4DL32_ANODA
MPLERFVCAVLLPQGFAQQLQTVYRLISFNCSSNSDGSCRVSVTTISFRQLIGGHFCATHILARFSPS